MGKSTTAAMFSAAGIPVWDADAAVHILYSNGGAGARAIEALVPAAIRDGGVDRSVLRQAIMDNAGLLKEIEAVIHPLVATDRAEFLKTHAAEPLIVLDIPLLFETGAADRFDGVLVVTADADVQKQRVLARAGMTTEVFATILSKQVPDAEKRKQADFVIDTGQGMDHAEAEVLALIQRLKEKSDA